MRRVAIGVTTFRRPGLLATLLDSLALLRSPGGRGVQPLVVVVDNDADGSARSVAEARAAVLPWPVRYVIEPRRGISHGRNRVVAEALDAGADHVAFIDDDETASPGWLAELLRVQAAFDADAVEGPVVPRYAPDVPDWVRRGGFFEEARWPTGTPRPTAKAGNVLITRRLLERHPRPFDPELGLSGGEDTAFFLRASRAGARIVWADGAIVEEHVPAERARAGWILRRAFRGGNGYAWCERAVGGKGWRWVRAAKGCGRIVEGAVQLSVGMVAGRAGVVRALCKVSLGVGALAGVAGMRYEAYRVTDGH
ncbi:MAG TPA: glycosyltransferase [Longimicrobiales bacterium]|nr:glycosyltransferase [Longimicrobiales bacterium]